MDTTAWIALAGLLLGGGGLAFAYKLARSLVNGMGEVVEMTGALKTLADAQLTENGGGSLVDKVNRTTALLPVIQETMEKNHKEAQAWGIEQLKTDVHELKQGRDEMLTELKRLGTDMAEFKRGHEFFRRFAPLLMALEPEDRRAKIQALAERVRSEMEANGGSQ